MKRFFSLILAAVLMLSLVSLVACGGDVVDEVSDKASDIMTTDRTTTEPDTSRETTDRVTADEDESMTGNVEDDSDGFIEDATSDDAEDDESAAR